MVIGIRPINDFAFKKVFGSPANKLALISLLNAILNPPVPIVDVVILNPFNLQDFQQDKLSILDVKATDQNGVIYDIEIQIAVRPGLVQRLVFYGCDEYAGQLRSGEPYTALKPVVVIALMEETLWADTAQLHHRFALMDRESGRELTDTLSIHTLELGKYNLTEAELGTATPLQRWLYWLIHAENYEPERLLERMALSG
ncbi:MAG: Rpn family recombination-promoting nuclease/putative transposase [Pirellulaceae bacterium]|nr:Rpn family recombination-promoting nuclease/putative transposase [Pirellulaceae bacterium]